MLMRVTLLIHPLDFSVVVYLNVHDENLYKVPR
jgi:hypothetical protein